jgi:hypothetical protein
LESYDAPYGVGYPVALLHDEGAESPPEQLLQ